jgi:hypothetical protein
LRNDSSKAVRSLLKAYLVVWSLPSERRHMNNIICTLSFLSDVLMYGCCTIPRNIYIYLLWWNLFCSETTPINNIRSFIGNHISGIMVTVLASSAVDRGFKPLSGKTKDYKIGICCFSAKHAALGRKSKDWLALNQNNVSEWSNRSIRGLLF